MLIPLDQLIDRHGCDVTRVLHLGAHLGEEADAYDAAGAKEVVWVEGNPEKIPLLLDHVRGRSGHYVTFAILGERDGDAVTLHIANNGESSSVLALGTHAREHREVHYTHDVTGTTRTVDSICDQLDFAPTFVNIDLQGVELPVLRGGERTIQRSVDYIYSEVNRKSLYRGCTLVANLDRYLAKLGFRPAETKWTRHHWGDRLYTRKVPR